MMTNYTHTENGFKACNDTKWENERFHGLCRPAVTIYIYMYIYKETVRDETM